jgi:Vps5 C terminal like
MIKKELERFELLRVQEFKVILIRYIESLMKNQQQVQARIYLSSRLLFITFSSCSSSKSGSHSCLKPRPLPDHSIAMLLQVPLLATKLIPYLIT